MVFLSTPRRLAARHCEFRPRLTSMFFTRRSAARHCEIRPPACENLLSSDFLSGR